ncbi:hypothetical protein CLAIMM_07472 [Cladophialophora immunda]|nr:hypothetical protein CLAIMM_07472 [Cladophialophora immunda]
MEIGAHLYEQIPSPAKTSFGINVPFLVGEEHRASPSDRNCQKPVLTEDSAAEQIHADPSAGCSPSKPSRRNSFTSVCRQVSIAPSRFAKLLTAKELYDLAPDPSLVPRPLTIRKQTRNVSASAPLESGAIDTHEAQSCREKRTGGRHLVCHIRDRLRSHQHAIIDTIARIVSNEVGVSDIANDMVLESNELTLYMANFGAAARDGPCVLDEAVQLLYSSVPATPFTGDKLCNALLSHGEIHKSSVLIDSANDKVETEAHEGKEIHHTRVASEGTLSWAEEEDDVFPDGHREWFIPQISGPDVENEEVFHDAQESQDETLSGESRMQLPDSNNSTYPTTDQAIQGWPHSSVVGFLFLRPPDVATERRNTYLGVPKAQVAEFKSMCTAIPSMVLIILAIMVGRLLGILLSELQGFALDH